ncbi:MAG: TonB-dependent receptor [Bacteroidales bacterium]|nr:TonB-dependent receptor [Bacteroidales bacterium]
MVIGFALIHTMSIAGSLPEITSFAGQGITIRGTVTDHGSSLPGVNVIVKGTATGTVTDVNGKYEINVPDAHAVLVFSFMGYTTVEIPVGEQREIGVELSEDTKNLEEVVIVGYGTAKKVTQTGAVSSVSTEELLRSPVPNVGNMLIGQVTGLSSIQTTGLPGADDPTILVRGIGTLNAVNARPLMLVDGVERSFFQLDPNEIESISVLKDASSTAVFGVQGANGVIIVTTKRGSEGAPRINVSLSAGMQVPLRVLDFVDSYDFCIAWNEMEGADVFPDDLMEKFKTQEDPLLYPSHNWIREIMKPFALQTQNNINISGGGNNIKYFASLGYFSQDGMFKKFDSEFHQNFTYNRYNYRTNFDIQATKSTKLKVSIGGVSGNRTEPRNTESQNAIATFRNIYMAIPYSAAGIIDGKLVVSNPRYVTSNVTSQQTPFSNWYGRGTAYTNNSEMNFDLELEQELDMIVSGLSASVKYSYNNRYTHTKNRTYAISFYTPWLIGHTNNWQDVDPNADPNEVVLVTNSEESIWGYNEGFSGQSRRFYVEGALNYNRTFGRHQVTGLFLGNMKKIFYQTNNNYPNVPLGSLGFVGRATYNYSQKYLFELNVGYNGSENFAKGKRFGFFPAVSAGWVLSEENFMKTVPFVSFFKIRASIGKVGMDNVGNNRFLYLPDAWNPNDGNYLFGTGLNIQSLSGAHEKIIGNPDVTWETAVKQNYGIDMSFLNGRLSVNVDRFFEKRDNILWLRSTVPAYVSVNLPRGNIGKVDNQGYEISIKWKNRLGRNRQNTYWAGGNVSYSRNKIVYMDEIIYDYPWRQETGHRVGQNFGYVFERLYRPSDFPEALKYNDRLKPGDAKYTDLNEDNQIDASDVKNTGYSRYPDFVFSFNAGFSYKGFDVSMLWQAATHVSKNLSGYYRMPFNTTANRNLMLYQYENRYVSESLTPDATFPRFHKETRNWNYDQTVTNSFWVKDASYLRLKNAEIGYRISPDFLQKTGIKNFRIFLNGTNLLTFDNLIFIDPEETGTDTDYPNLAIINLGINFTF